MTGDRKPLTSEQYTRVKDLFHRATQVPKSGRRAFVEHEAGGDPQVAAEALSLLEHHETEAQVSLKSDTLPILKEDSKATSRTLSRAEESRLIRRFAVTFLLMGALALGATGLWSHRQVQASLAAAVAHELQAIRDIEVQALRYWVESRINLAQELTKSDEVNAAARRQLVRTAKGDYDLKELKASEDQAILRKVLKARGKTWDFFGYGLVDPAFRIIASDHEPLIGAQITTNSNHEFVLQVLRGSKPTFGPPRVFGTGLADPNTPVQRKWVVMYAVGVPGPEGEPVGAHTFGEFVDKNLQAVLNVGRMGSSGESYAIDGNGVMVTTSRFFDDLAKAHVAAGRDLADFADGIPVRDPGGDVLEDFVPTDTIEAWPHTRLAAQTLAAQKTKDPARHAGVIVEPYRDYRGVEVVGAWRWIPEWGFGVVTEVDASEAFAPLKYLKVASGSVTVALLLMAVAWGVVAFALFQAKRRFKLRRLGSYELVRKLAEGGIGAVFLARHDQLRRPAAVKVLKEEHPSLAMLTRFEQEATLVCRLSHPNTVKIYDFGVADDGRMYLAMEYLRGINLSELLAIEGRVSPSRTIYVIRQLALSLAEAHDLGLVHRDVKPLNVMLCHVGGAFDFVKVLDFGLVKSTTDAQDSDDATRRFGTPLYMAPERLRSGAKVDHRSDIYSLGVLMYVLLTGRNPYDGDDDLQLIQNILAGKPKTMRVAQDVPPALEHLTLLCMASDADLRPQSAEEVLEDLEAMDVPPWTEADAFAWWQSRPTLLTQANISLKNEAAL